MNINNVWQIVGYSSIDENLFIATSSCLVGGAICGEGAEDYVDGVGLNTIHDLLIKALSANNKVRKGK